MKRREKMLRFLVDDLQLFHSPDGGDGEGGAPGNDNDNENLSAKEYVENIKKLKASTVSKEEYDRLLADRAELARALIDSQPGTGSGGGDGDDDAPSIEDLRKKLFGAGSESLSNLDFAKSALELRKQVIASGGYDPFVPQGAKARATPEDYDAAQRVADVLQDCVDKSEGDSGAFTAYLMSRLDDVPMPKKRN